MLGAFAFRLTIVVNFILLWLHLVDALGRKMEGKALTNGYSKSSDNSQGSPRQSRPQVKVVPAAGQDGDDLVDLVLLAWILLLRRGYGGDFSATEAAYSWRRPCGEPASWVKELNSLGKFTWPDTELIMTCLSDVRKSRQRDTSDGEGRGEDSNQEIYLFTSNSQDASSSGVSSLYKMCLAEARADHPRPIATTSSSSPAIGG